MRSIRFALLAVALSAPLAAQQSVTVALPGAAEADGREGAHFSSLLSLVNPGTAPVDVTVALIPSAGVEGPKLWHGSVAGNRNVNLDQVLNFMFGPGTFVGTLMMTTAQPLPATLVTSNVANAAGTYGLALRPIEPDDVLRRGSVGHLIWADQDDAFRTNVGVTLLEPESSVVVRVFDAAGTLVGQTTVASPTTSSWQRSIADIVGAPLTHGRVDLVPNTGSATGYVSVLDNLTSDGIALQPDRRNSEVWYLDGVSHSPGVGDTFFTTDVRIWNPGTAPLEVTFEPIGMPGILPKAKTVETGAVTSFDDVVASVLGAPSGSAGALRLRADAPFYAAARTANVAGGAGTFGAFVRAVEPSEFLGAGGRAVLAPIQQMTGTEGFRTNLALLSGPAGAKGKMRLAGDDAGDLEVEFELPADSWVQKRVQGWFGPTTSIGSRYVVVEVDSGSVDAYASRIDNGTGDATVIPPSVLVPGVPPTSPGDAPM